MDAVGTGWTAAPAALRHATQHIQASQGQIRVDELARKAYLSERQLERVIGTAMGLTPKRYIRLVRIYHALKHAVCAQRSVALVDIAHSYGFSDQAHFCREVRLSVDQPVSRLIGALRFSWRELVTKWPLPAFEHAKSWYA
jgi:transcriptional regulator GlxA family with amidase domain